MRKAARILVKGTVQGVFYRQFIKEHADKLSLTGFIRNLESGDVEIILEGEQDSINRLHAFSSKGPEHSHIRSSNLEERKWSGEFKDFKILRF